MAFVTFPAGVRVIPGFAASNHAVVTAGAGTGHRVMLTAAHLNIGPATGAMAAFTGVERQDVVARLAGGNGAVMTVHAGTADPTVIHAGTGEAVGIVTTVALGSCDDVVGRFARRRSAVMTG